MACSPARLLANRENAKRSKGPTTPEGKSRSRRNSLKHGMTGAGIVLPSEDVAAVAARFSEFEADLKPRNGVARYLVERTALLSVRLDRCARQESAMLSEKVTHAEGDFDERRIAEAEALMAGLAAEPAANARALRRTPEGVDLMIRAWLGIRDDLARPRATRQVAIHEEMAENLTGRRVSDLPISRPYALFQTIRGNVDFLGSHDDPGLDIASRRDWAKGRLIEWIDEELGRLRALRETFDLDAIAQERAGSVDRVLFDTSKEAILARKYEAAASREFFRTLRELEQVHATVEETTEPGPALGSSFPEAPAEPSPVEEAEEPARIVQPRRPTPAPIVRYLEEFPPIEPLEQEVVAMGTAQAEFA